MIHKIENEFLSVEINSLGAELFSIKSKKTGVEYLWQGNEKYWKDRSPNLFPICGRLFGGKYYYKGAEYKMDIHGFIKTMEFVARKISEQEIEFMLKTTAQTKKWYPFDFVLRIKYSLLDSSLKTQFIVENIGEKDLYFSYGAHPGFNVPLSSGEEFNDYYLEFSKSELEKLVFSDTCFNTGKTQKIALDCNRLNLSHDLFDNDAIFVKADTDSVKLKSKNGNNYVEVGYNNATCLGLWHKPKSDAPYVCIEPWHGVPSLDGKVDDLETKLDTITLEKGKTHENYFVIKIVEN